MKLCNYTPDSVYTDEFSGTLLGESGQLEVIGHNGKTGPLKYYILFCSVCSKDRELFGEGYFLCRKSNLGKGNIPCGCSKSWTPSEDQAKVLCSRKAKELGHEFLGWVGGYKGTGTFCELSCRLHGKWKTTRMYSLVRNSHSCIKCRNDLVGNRFSKRDEDIIRNFKGYPAGTLFKRCEGQQGKAGFWKVSCPVCNVEYKSYSSSLRAGHIGCMCGTHDYKYCYINIIYDNSTPIAIKFGVSKQPDRRLKIQNSNTIYSVCKYGVWEFPDKESCLNAERLCLGSFETRVINKLEFEDGWTETTHINNLDKIVQIYENNSGRRVNDE